MDRARAGNSALAATFGRVDEIDPQTAMDRLGRGSAAFGAGSTQSASGRERVCGGQPVRR